MPEFVLPEFTRSLRALAVPSTPGSDHDRVFAPLIQARTLAHKAQSLEAQLAAFDAARLERGWRAAIAALAEDRHRASPPDCRALEAQLLVLSDPLWQAIGGMNTAADAARRAQPDQRRASWERWVECVRVLFRAADDWWSAALPVLGRSA